MSSHKIIYLDQNYLSNMAKARLGSMKTEADVVFWQSLFDDLKKAVLDDKIACPQSSFHRYESSFAKRLEDAIRRVIDKLSWGLKFHPNGPYELILESQIEDAAREFLGKQPEKREPWSIAFESDPQEPVESRMHDVWGTKGRISVHLSFSDKIVEHDRQLKRQFANDTVLPVTYQKTCLGWSELLLREKLSFICSLFGLSLLQPDYLSWLKRQCSGPPVGRFAVNERIADSVRVWERLTEIGICVKDATTAANFLDSDELLNIPHIDISCSIHAAINKYYPNRKKQQGDFYDIPILATVLPYCDIVTTDSFMKEIIVKKLHFDDKYKARIFSATKADRLAFQKTVRAIS